MVGLDALPAPPRPYTVISPHFPHVRHGDIILSTLSYNYTTLVIGLLGLIGSSTMLHGLLFGKHIVPLLRLPLLSVAVVSPGRLLALLSALPLGAHFIVGPALQALLLDAGLMIE